MFISPLIIKAWLAFSNQHSMNVGFAFLWKHAQTSSITMSSIAQKRSFFPIPSIPTSTSTSTNPSLPVSHTNSYKQNEGGLRRRLISSMSLKIQATPAISSWPFPRSKSLSSMGDYAGTSIRKWWDWGWAWILSRKPIFARDLEMNEQETKLLGSHNRGSWRHVFCKVRSEIRRLITSDRVVLPQTYSFDDARRTTQAQPT